VLGVVAMLVWCCLVALDVSGARNHRRQIENRHHALLAGFFAVAGVNPPASFRRSYRFMVETAAAMFAVSVAANSSAHRSLKS
jgi:hypothetical protein